MHSETWSRDIARAVYGLEHSIRGGVVDVDEEGYLVIKLGDHSFRVKDLMKQFGLDVAYIRILPLIKRAMTLVYETYSELIKATGYKGSLLPVYPMKVNPVPIVVESIFKYGEKCKWGFNTGSLGELQLLVNLAEKYSPRTLIYDGVFTEKVIESLLKLHSLGWRVIVDIESERDAEIVEKYPDLEVGIRVKPITRPHGKWSESAGLSGKFGLTMNTLVKIMDDFKWITKRAVLLHMHPGSQISKFTDVKTYVKELRGVYEELLEMGFENISIVDPGGGLAYPYVDVRDGDEESPDYSIVDYAKLLISEFSARSKNPDLVFEAGRFIVASHRILVSKVIDVRPYSAVRYKESTNMLQDYVEKIRSIRDAKAFISKIKEVLSGLRQGGEKEVKSHELYEDLTALIEEEIAQRVSTLLSTGEISISDILSEHTILRIMTSPSKRYVLNMSIFADIPDAVLVDQYFQVVPAQGLNKQPDVLASLADLTCDSMGEISLYISPGNFLDVKKPILTTLDSRLVAIPGIKLKLRGVPLSLPMKNEDYYIAILDTGAYQDTLAMKHNLIYGAPEVIIDINEEGVSIRVIRNGEIRV